MAALPTYDDILNRLKANREHVLDAKALEQLCTDIKAAWDAFDIDQQKNLVKRYLVIVEEVKTASAASIEEVQPASADEADKAKAVLKQATHQSQLSQGLRESQGKLFSAYGKSRQQTDIARKLIADQAHIQETLDAAAIDEAKIDDIVLDTIDDLISKEYTAIASEQMYEAIKALLEIRNKNDTLKKVTLDPTKRGKPLQSGFDPTKRGNPLQPGSDPKGPGQKDPSQTPSGQGNKPLGSAPASDPSRDSKLAVSKTTLSFVEQATDRLPKMAVTVGKGRTPAGTATISTEDTVNNLIDTLIKKKRNISDLPKVNPEYTQARKDYIKKRSSTSTTRLTKITGIQTKMDPKSIESFTYDDKAAGRNYDAKVVYVPFTGKFQQIDPKLAGQIFKSKTDVTHIVGNIWGPIIDLTKVGLEPRPEVEVPVYIYDLKDPKSGEIKTIIDMNINARELVTDSNKTDEQLAPSIIAKVETAHAVAALCKARNLHWVEIEFPGDPSNPPLTDGEFKQLINHIEAVLSSDSHDIVPFINQDLHEAMIKYAEDKKTQAAPVEPPKAEIRATTPTVMTKVPGLDADVLHKISHISAVITLLNAKDVKTLNAAEAEQLVRAALVKLEMPDPFGKRAVILNNKPAI